MAPVDWLTSTLRRILPNWIRALWTRNVKWTLVLITWLGFLFYWYQALIVCVIGSGLPEASAHNFFEVNLIWALIVCIFFSAMYSPPKAIPEEYRIRGETMDKKQKEQIGENLLKCHRCNLYKPPRTHHCKACDRCILRMDHHCPILQACVHHHNYKFYLLYLFVPCFLGIYVTIWLRNFMGRMVMKMMNVEDPSLPEHLIIGAYYNALIITVSLLWLSRIQFKQAFHNRTTIEQNKIETSTELAIGSTIEIYDLGSVKANLVEIFGEPRKIPGILSFLKPLLTMIYWLLPINSTRGDGCAYKAKILHANKSNF